METINEAWAGILSYLHQLSDISEVGFKTWLECIEPKNIDGVELVLYVQTHFQKKMVKEQEAEELKKPICPNCGSKETRRVSNFERKLSLQMHGLRLTKLVSNMSV